MTHETLVNRRWAGAALELETSRGRVFSFEPVCSSTPKHKRTTITAASGMEILSLQIQSGALVGYEQQPCREESGADKDESGADKEWYSVIYQGTKEDEVEVREFSEKQEAGRWWQGIRDKCRQKAGRGALFLNTKRNKILNKTGSEKITADLMSEAERKGMYVAMKENATKLSLSGMFSGIYKALSTGEQAMRMLILVSLLLCGSIVDLEILSFTGQLLSVISDNTTAYNQSFYGNVLCQTVLECGNRFEHVRAMLIGFVFMVILEQIVELGMYYSENLSLRGISGNLRIQSLEKALSLHKGYHDSHTTAEVHSVMGKAGAMTGLVTWTIPSSVSQTFGILASGFYLVKADLTIGTTVIIMTVLYNVVYLMPARRKYMRISRAQGKLSCGAAEHQDEALSMMSTVKNFSQEARHVEEQRVAEKCSASYDLTIVLYRILDTLFMQGFKYFLLAFLMAYELTASESRFGPGEFMTFYLVFSRFQGQFSYFDYQIKDIQKCLTAVESYVEFMSTPCEVVSGSETVASLEEDIKFENVHFGYPARIGEKVFSGLDLKIQRKKVTALVGDSGAGKSTIAKLLMRLYDPQQGRITIGGKDIRDYDLTGLHGKMTIVSQDPTLMNSTIIENISYGAVSPDEITMERVKKAAELANCDFINKFRSGLNTFAGSQGLQLSGGQKQRVAIARAAMRDPEILILDEATSALDAQNEKEVQEALDKLMKGKTTIVIAHRLSTIRQADEIICLKDGEVKERGTHDELMRLGEYYANLVSKQLVEDTCKTMKAGSEDEVKRLLQQVSQELVRQESQVSKNSQLTSEKDLFSEKCSQVGDNGPLFGDAEIDENDFGPPKG